MFLHISTKKWLTQFETEAAASLFASPSRAGRPEIIVKPIYTYIINTYKLWCNILANTF